MISINELIFEYVYSQTTAATTVQCTTSVQQIGQRLIFDAINLFIIIK